MTDILYVDDEPDAFIAHAPRDQTHRVEVIRYPDVPNGNSLEQARVWLFDFFLLKQSKSGVNDENGLSLFQKWRAPVGSARPTTVLISSDLAVAMGEPLGPLERRHVVAQRHGVEWIAAKTTEDSGETWRQVIELADAAAMLARSFKPASNDAKKYGTYQTAHLCFDVLGVPRNAEWASSAQRQIDRARPPREIPIATEAATARAIIGWLIMHVLPYPSFLLTDAQAALRLQVTPESYRALVDAVERAAGSDGHRAKLLASRYTGPLASFFGRRWWRAGIDDLAWQLSEAISGFDAALKTVAGILPLERLNGFDEPVLLSDANLVETSDVARASDCVRVTDEDFPANVEPAWVRIADVKENRELAAKVIFEDRDYVEPAV